MKLSSLSAIRIVIIKKNMGRTSRTNFIFEMWDNLVKGIITAGSDQAFTRSN